MHDVAGFRMGQGVGELRGDRDGAGHIEGAGVLHEVPQVHALNKLEDDVVPALFTADGIHAADVFMVEPGSRLGLIFEASQQVGIVGAVLEEHLDGNRAVERRVAAAKHGPHAATTDKLLQLVDPEPLALKGPANVGHAGVERPAFGLRLLDVGSDCSRVALRTL